MRFTVFTPTYNRGYIIEQVFESLQKQTFADFEWIVVDDGSTDNTEEIMKRIMLKDHEFPIVYKKVKNGGKHRAWNLGLDLARGELFFGCDSDDYLTNDALYITDKVERSIPNGQKENYAGVCGLKGYKDRTIVGEIFGRQSYEDMTHIERIKKNITGDKAEVLYTSIWKKYKYYEFEGEKFLTEATSLNRMAEEGLKIRYFNRIIKIIEYLPDGLSADIEKRFNENPKGEGIYIYQMIKNGILKGRKKYHALWKYYNDHIMHLTIKEMAHNLHMSRYQFFQGVLIERIIKKIRL